MSNIDGNYHQGFLLTICKTVDKLIYSRKWYATVIFPGVCTTWFRVFPTLCIFSRGFHRSRVYPWIFIGPLCCSLWLAIVVALLWFIWTNLIFITLSLLFQKHLLLWVPLTACSSVSLLTGWPNLNQWMKNTLHVLRAMQRSVKLSRIPCILLPFFSLWKQDGERIHHRVHVIFDRNGREKWTIQIQYAVEQINSTLPCVCSVTDPRWC